MICAKQACVLLALCILCGCAPTSTARRVVSVHLCDPPQHPGGFASGLDPGAIRVAIGDQIIPRRDFEIITVTDPARKHVVGSPNAEYIVNINPKGDALPLGEDVHIFFSDWATNLGCLRLVRGPGGDYDWVPLPDPAPELFLAELLERRELSLFNWDAPPIFGVETRLADIWSIAEFVVQGTTGNREIIVKKVLFGELPGEINTQRRVPLGKYPIVPADQSGVWFLVLGPDGYVSLNPNCKPVSPEVFGSLTKPAEHWTTHAEVVANRCSDTQVYHSYTRPDSNDTVRHGTDVFVASSRVNVGAYRHGKRFSWFQFDATGAITALRHSGKDHGFYVDYHQGQLVEWAHYWHGKQHGTYRRYFRSDPKQLREEKQFTKGVIDGRSREWNEKGEVLKDVMFDMGLILPIIRYKGKGTSGIVAHRSTDGVTYSNAPAVGKVEVGMTVQEVSELLKVDFSPTQGLMFMFYQKDRYLHIGFKDAKVDCVSTGHNGVCIGRVE